MLCHVSDELFGFEPALIQFSHVLETVTDLQSCRTPSISTPLIQGRLSPSTHPRIHPHPQHDCQRDQRTFRYFPLRNFTRNDSQISLRQGPGTVSRKTARLSGLSGTNLASLPSPPSRTPTTCTTENRLVSPSTPSTHIADESSLATSVPASKDFPLRHIFPSLPLTIHVISFLHVHYI
ncbi:uncharacterized protein MYCFIDRAFT_172937 [Pseudocercospora fijiensis CIRAD86]|uniref:Uncharacterized protein n=1 Tax=Pseudocercospora fijiensis (strain CIRAD86) TaxID=383855 RepID=M3B3B4_PSEFD|nr:uncharacterized protein MYCFIDRAFT_172937 [Pseudocercospora fijiensis CIRAD86]EME83867.1 hypothetical protein MYCFIDRAFT_172937 [Pseudocercospora fijiensis CIRAD86]